MRRASEPSSLKFLTPSKRLGFGFVVEGGAGGDGREVVRRPEQNSTGAAIKYKGRIVRSLHLLLEGVTFPAFP